MTIKEWLWKQNDEWYDYDENDYVYIKDDAPDEVKANFEQWKEWANKLWEEGILV